MSDEEKTAIYDGKAGSLTGPAKDHPFVVVLSGAAMGKTFRIEKKEVVLGRSKNADILLDDHSVSRLHAKLIFDGRRIVLKDLNSTNGTFANGQRVSETELKDGDKIQIGNSTVLKFTWQDDMENVFHEELYRAAVLDALTQVYNKKYFLERMQSEFSHSLRHHNPLALLMFDLDHFKQLNDTYGHPAGDAVLRDVAARIKNVLRTEDIFARYGGEEFTILLRETDAERAFLIGERVRRCIESPPFVWEKKTIKVTISIGVVTLQGDNFKSSTDFLKGADSFLYRAKEGGRNRVESPLIHT